MYVSNALWDELYLMKDLHSLQNGETPYDACIRGEHVNSVAVGVRQSILTALQDAGRLVCIATFRHVTNFRVHVGSRK